MSNVQREPTDWFSDDMQRRVRRRYQANSRFKWYGIISIGTAFAMLAWLLSSIISDGIPGFQQTQMELTVEVDRDRLVNGLDEKILAAVEANARQVLVVQRVAGQNIDPAEAFRAREKIDAELAVAWPAVKPTAEAIVARGIEDLTLDGEDTVDFSGLLPANTPDDVVLALEEAVITAFDAQAQEAIDRTDYGRVVRETMMAEFPEVTGRREVRQLTGIVSSGARKKIREAMSDDRSLIGQQITIWVPTSDDVHTMMTGSMSRDVAEDERRLKDTEIVWVDKLDAEGRIRTVISKDFFTSGDSREPELAGIWGATVGSFLTLLVTLLIAFPIGVLAALYLEEFAKKGWLSDLIEVNINNLAAVPSIVFGLLGLAIYLNVFHLPRSAPIVGGMTLALMTLPTIIIAARAALKAVPPSIRDAAIGLGASRIQVTFQHVLPLAMPGILTGTIIGMAQALGETAPLLMIGMVAFVADVPGGIFDPSTVLPVQIFIWADSPERAFEEKTSAAIIVLLTFLVLMNALAVVLRKRFEQKW